MTYLEAVNKILIRLREDEVTAVSETKYSKLLGELVNESLRDVENAWRWVALRQTVQAVTVSGDYRYFLDGVKEGFTIRDVNNITTKNKLYLSDSKRLTDQFNNEALAGEPSKYDIAGVDAATGDYQIDFYPIPNDVWTINIDLERTQSDIITDADEILVPSYPVMLGAYYKAIVERGEDGGMMAAEAYQNYKTSLGDEIAMDATRSARGTHDWTSGMIYERTPWQDL